MTLYELTAEMLEMMENLEESAEFEVKADEFKNKAEGYGKIIRNLQGDIEVMNGEIERLANNKKATENNIKRLKRALRNAMTALELRKFKTPLFSFWIQANPPSVDDHDPSKIPPKYWKTPEPVLDKRELLDDLKSGVIVEGAALSRSESLRIR